MKKTLLMAMLMVGSVAANAQVLYSTSFESPDFATGALDTQNSWLAAAGYSVTDSVAKTGSQAAQWSGTGGTYAWVDLGTIASGTELIAKVSVFIDPTTANNERAFGFRMWSSSPGGVGVTVNSDGLVRASSTYADLWSGTGVGSVSNATGRWLDMTMVHVIGSTEATVTVDSFTTTVSGLTALPDVVDVDLFSDWNNVNADSIAYYDDYSVGVVPEPFTLGALALGALALRRRSKK